jgi:hypothetical protein
VLHGRCHVCAREHPVPRVTAAFYRTVATMERGAPERVVAVVTGWRRMSAGALLGGVYTAARVYERLAVYAWLPLTRPHVRIPPTYTHPPVPRSNPLLDCGRRYAPDRMSSGGRRKVLGGADLGSRRPPDSPPPHPLPPQADRTGWPRALINGGIILTPVPQAPLVVPLQRDADCGCAGDWCTRRRTRTNVYAALPLTRPQMRIPRTHPSVPQSNPLLDCGRRHAPVRMSSGGRRTVLSGADLGFRRPPDSPLTPPPLPPPQADRTGWPRALINWCIILTLVSQARGRSPSTAC